MTLKCCARRADSPQHDPGIPGSFWDPCLGLTLLAWLQWKSCLSACVAVDKKQNSDQKTDTFIYTMSIPLNCRSFFFIDKDFSEKASNQSKQTSIKMSFSIKPLSYCPRAQGPRRAAHGCSACVQQQHWSFLHLPL